MLAAMSITKRIYAGFGVVLTLLAALAAFTYYELNAVGGMFTEYRDSARQSKLVAEMAEHVSGARMAVMKYRASGSDADAARVADEIATYAEHSEEFIALVGADSEAGQAATALQEGSAQYAEAFAQIRALDAEFNATMTTILAAAEEAGDRIDAATAITGSTDLQVAYTGIMRDFLLARNSTSKFVFADDLDALAEAHYRLTAVHDALQAIAARPGAALAKPAEAALAPIQVYIDSVDVFQRIGAERNRINQDVLNVIGPEAQAALGDLQDTLFARQDALGPTTAAEIEATKIAAEIVSIIAILIGLALAYVIGRWIAGAVRGMADTMSKMAEGDFDAEVTGAEHKHELGAMARALQVFAENGREKARLDAEAAKAAERERAESAEAEKLTNAIREAVRRAVDGDFGGRVEEHYADEVKVKLARSVNRLMETVSDGLGSTVAVMASLARGDLDKRMDGAYRGAFAELQTNVNGTVAKLRETVGEIMSATRDMRKATGEIADGASDLSSRAENQAASLEEVAATMEEMSATVKKNAENAVSASSLSSDARSRADKGGRIVEQAVTAMSEIEAGSGKIADIVSVIDGFAFQTNLLALNAAVEAARAGEAGKGFAVVASEVRTLAQRSAEAARDIKELIDQSSGQVKDGVRLVKETGDSLASIMEAIRQVTETVTEISEASREQSSGVDEITSALTSMDEITQQNSALAEESASAARGVGERANGLDRVVSFFRMSGGAGAAAAAFDADAKADSQAARSDAAVA